MKKLLHRPFFIRLRNWEYWNSTLVYTPIFPWWLWLSLKARSFMFFTAANPRIKNGGFIMESKRDVYDLLPGEYYPETVYVEAGTTFEVINEKIKRQNIQFPYIAKPDIGERGLAVKKIHSETELRDYLTHIPVPFLVQSYVAYENEIGIFYYRVPGATTGKISGIVKKEPVTITGDGRSTVTELVKQNERYLLQWAQIRALNPELLDIVLATGDQRVLVPYGNHSRGSKFTDETFRATEKLNETIDRICSRIPEFYYGRLDVRFESWELLEQGKAFAIIELNGSGSEPTHIYDPKHSIVYAWREIIRHWNILYTISKENNKRGVQYISLAHGRKEMNAFKLIDAQLSARIW